MAGILFRPFSIHRSQIMGRGLRAVRVRLSRKRRAIRSVRRTLKALKIAAVEIEVRNRRIREEYELMFVYNILSDQWVHDRLVELENEPLMRDAFERINAQNVVGGDFTDVNQVQPFQDGGAGVDRRE